MKHVAQGWKLDPHQAPLCTISEGLSQEMVLQASRETDTLYKGQEGEGNTLHTLEQKPKSE